MNQDNYIPEPNSGCWLWLGSLGSGGYGIINQKGRTRAAHRFLYEEHHGVRVPSDLVCDHKCRTRSCVNPAHIRIVDVRTNTLENSVAVTAINAAKTHCDNGHEFTPENTKIRIRDNTMRRICITCQRVYNLAFWHRNKAALQLAQTEENK